MKTQSTRTSHKKRRALLGVSFTIALIAHVLLLVMLQDVYIECSSPSSLVSSKYPGNCNEWELRQAQAAADEAHRNSQLMEVFDDSPAPSRLAGKPDRCDWRPDTGQLSLNDLKIDLPMPNSVVDDRSLLAKIEATPLDLSGGQMNLEERIPIQIDENSPTLADSLILATNRISSKNAGRSTDAPAPDLALHNAMSFGDRFSDVDDHDPSAGIASSDDFDVDVQYAPCTDGKGYLFQLRFVPKEQVRFKRIRQNVFFLVDRSHSIDRSRYEYTKKAVLDALRYLRRGDTFNILVFDNGVIHMSNRNVPWNPRNVAAAQQFLHNTPHGGLFAATDIYSSLDKIVPRAVSPQEVNTAILLSDGNTYLSPEDQRLSISRWTQKNAGKVSLYSVAVGRGNNLPLLQLLSLNNKGILMYRGHEDNLSDVMSQMMRGIANPIGKDIVVTAVPREKGSTVKIYPKQQRLPDLYGGTPYVLYGWVKDPKNFYLFVQGKYYDRWLDIRKEISFSSAGQGDIAALEKNWSLLKAYDHYDGYLADGDNRHLTEARALLAPYKMADVFQ